MELALLSTDETAALLRTTVTALAAQRSRGSGPRFVRLGRRIYYRPQDLTDYINSSVYTGTADYL